MAEFVLPPEMEAFAEAAGDAAMGPFQAADFAADPSAAFSEGMGAAMDFMTDAGMPPDMMANIADVAQGAFDAHMAANPDSPPMDAFDAVGGALDFHMAEFPADMPCMDMAGDFPPPPEDFGPMMDGAPPYGDFPGGPEFDPGAMPGAWEPGPMTDMPPPGDMGPEGPPPGEGGPPPGDMAVDQDQTDQWDLLQVIWVQDQMDQWTSSRRYGYGRNGDQMDQWVQVDLLQGIPDGPILQVIWVQTRNGTNGTSSRVIWDHGPPWTIWEGTTDGPPPGMDMDGTSSR